MPRFSEFPEELIDSVLSYSSPSSRQAILLVCRSFYRIGSPLFYHTIAIKSQTQLQRLLALALLPNPLLATYIRHIVLPGIWAEAGELLYRCRNTLRVLDVTLDSVLNTQGHDPEGEAFCRGLHQLTNLTHIVIRKPNNVYLTRPKLQFVLSEITKAMHNWDNLEYVDLAFRLSDDSGGTAALLAMLPISVPLHRPRSAKLPGPVTQLTQVLSSRPKLHTFSTHLPNVWNENILRVSQNPALERIILIDGSGDAKDGTTYDGSGCGSGIAGTGHFFAQARRHSRLSELVRAGTSITRCRAQTMGNPSNSGYYPFGRQMFSMVSASSCSGPTWTQGITHGREICSGSPSVRTSSSHSWEYHPFSLTSGSMVGPSKQNPPLSTSAP